MIAVRWNALAPGERRMLGFGAPLAVLLLGWAFAWHPLAMKRADLQRQVEQQQRDLASLRAGTAEVERLHATGMRSRADRQGRSLLALADATARGDGLERALRRVEPVGARGVRVDFEAVAFDRLVAWLEGLSRDYGVEANDLSADRADGIGLVNARVTLQDAP